jgi:hypothetical protein
MMARREKDKKNRGVESESANNLCAELSRRIIQDAWTENVERNMISVLRN